MTIGDDLSQLAVNARKPRPTHPKGWEPGFEWDGRKGTIVRDPSSDASPPQFTALLEELCEAIGEDPADYEIVGDIQVRRWQQTPGDEYLYYHRATISRTQGAVEDLDVDALLAAVAKRKPRKVAETSVTGAGLVVAMGDWQAGKALADDTPMLTPDGWTTHGALRPGDEVYGPYGLPRRVLAVTGSTVQPVWRVRFDGGASLVATADHRWTGFRRMKDAPYTGYTRRSMTLTTNELAALPVAHSRGRAYANSGFHVSLPDPISLRSTELPIDPYVLGAWLGDGNSRSGWLCVGAEDVDHFEPYGRYMPHDNHGTKALRVDGLTKALRKLGVLENKHVPDAYLMAHAVDRLALLQGLMDTDGYCSETGLCEFTNVNMQLTSAVRWLLASLGVKSSFAIKKTTHQDAGRIQFRCDRDDLPVFRMKRKLDRQPTVLADNQSRYRFVQSVEPAGEVSAQCITVEGSLYLAGPDLVVTHNSDGDGVEGTISRLGVLPALIEARWSELRRIGVPLDVIYLCFLGDLRESCGGHYAQQAFRTMLNNRDQRKVIRTSAERIIDRAAGFAPQVAVKVVGGNHGEEREAGKSATDFGDNVDVAVIEDIAYAYSLNPDRYPHVGFAIPNDDLTLTFDHDGTVVGLAHGHQAGFGSGDPRTKIHNWWKGQMDGQLPIGDADILVTAHYHHPWMIRRGSRTHFGCPALDGGSDWFRNQTGMDAPPSTLSFVVTGSGWDHMALLGGEPR